MICKLCQNEVPKLVNSHIISEFMYRGLYDEKHRFFGISSEPTVKERLLQKGIREELLCERCDNAVLAPYENYVSGLLYGGVLHRSGVDGNQLRLLDLDYKQVRLFFLSLLWRMSVSGDPFFAQVHLGPHEELLRTMIVQRNPGEPDEYGFLCIAPLFDGQHLGDWIISPDCVRSLNRRVYRCLIGGLLYSFFVGKAKLPKKISERFVQKDGSWVIQRERIEKLRYLHNWCVKMGLAIEKRRSGKRSTPTESAVS